jgi:hypothetical protein
MRRSSVEVSEEHIGSIFKVSQGENQHEAGSKHSLLFHSEDGGNMSVDFHRTAWCYIPEARTLGI